jgi:uncharacterized protein
MRKHVGLIVLLLCLITPWAHAFELPDYQSTVYDPASQLTAGEALELKTKIQELHDRDNMMTAIALIPSLDGQSVEQTAVDLFKKWQLGEKGKDNGLLILVAVQDHKMKIETGYGLEGDLPDVVCSHVIDEQMKPELRKNNFEKGLMDALDELGRYRTHELDKQSIPLDQRSADLAPFDRKLFAGLLAFNFLPFILAMALLAFRILSGWKFYVRSLDWGALSGSFSVSLLLGLFFGVFAASGAPLASVIGVSSGFLILPFSFLVETVRMLKKRSTFDTLQARWTPEEVEKRRAALSEDKRLKKEAWAMLPVSKRFLALVFGTLIWSTKKKKWIPKPFSSSGGSSSGWGSSSSSSSFSSSSGGGSSGGGGASGSW